ncbi:SRR1-like protein [Anolis carolinensis]|uniref:SRR1-like protein n=1 Tax=Anolis carolinensis TaxID=28377 RepID=UPI002F2B8353
MDAEAGWKQAGESGGKGTGSGRKEEGSDPGEVLERRLKEISSELQSSGFWDSSQRIILQSLRKPFMMDEDEDNIPSLEKLNISENFQCVSFGIGNFSSCSVAKTQMAFLLLLLQELQISRDCCFVFDPVFSELELEVLCRLGLKVMAENEEGKHGISGVRTLFFMVHCGKSLYNNLLWSNWAPETLSKMAVLGNSFRGIQDRMPSKIFQKEYSYIAKILPATDETPFPAHPQYMEIFNDTSVHCFPSSKLKELSGEIWKLPEEPVYEENEEGQLEIIRKSQKKGICTDFEANEKKS